VKYAIDVSLDGGKSWRPMIRDWSVTRRGDEPRDFWSQSFCWGKLELDQPAKGPVRIRFSNSGGRSYARCEAHLAYRVSGKEATRVTFASSDDRGNRQASHTFAAAGSWLVPTGKGVRTRWVEFEAVSNKD
jgi:hypothetical protein